MARRRLSNLGCSVLPNKRKPPFSGSATFGADAEESARFALSLSIAGESRNFRSRDPRNRSLAKVKDFPGCETQLKPAGFEPSDTRMPILNEAGNLRHDDGFRRFFSWIYGKDERHAFTECRRTENGTLRILLSI
jgi:hypothetical protein